MRINLPNATTGCHASRECGSRPQQVTLGQERGRVALHWQVGRHEKSVDWRSSQKHAVQRPAAVSGLQRNTHRHREVHQGAAGQIGLPHRHDEQRDNGGGENIAAVAQPKRMPFSGRRRRRRRHHPRHSITSSPPSRPLDETGGGDSCNASDRGRVVGSRGEVVAGRRTSGAVLPGLEGRRRHFAEERQ